MEQSGCVISRPEFSQSRKANLSKRFAALCQVFSVLDHHVIGSFKPGLNASEKTPR